METMETLNKDIIEEAAATPEDSGAHRKFSMLSEAERRLVEMNPDTGFISKFGEWVALKSDASGWALKAGALISLSLAAGDCVILKGLFDDGPVYMNLYILLTGPSTSARKTTVLGRVRRILPVTELNAVGDPYVRILDDVSVQAFNKEMALAGAAQKPILYNPDEVSGVFGMARSQNHFLAQFPKSLLKAYDHSPVHIARVGNNIDTETGAFVSVFAASVEGPLAEVFEVSDMESGLLPRFLIFNVRDADRGARIPLDVRDANDEEYEKAERELLQILAKIAAPRISAAPTGQPSPYGLTFEQYVIPSSAESTARLDQADATIRKMGEDPELEDEIVPMMARGFDYAYKLAGIFALSRAETYEGAQIELIDVLRGFSYVEDSLEDVWDLRERFGENLLERRIKEVEKLLTKVESKRQPKAAVATKLGVSFRDLAEVGMTMSVRGLIKEETLQNRLYWTWTKGDDDARTTRVRLLAEKIEKKRRGRDRLTRTDIREIVGGRTSISDMDAAIDLLVADGAEYLPGASASETSEVVFQ